MQGWLTGWKAIANHFDVGWKVAKRWHQVYNMPILRTPENRPTNTPQELDAWFIEFNNIVKRKKKGKNIKLGTFLPNIVLIWVVAR